MAASTPCPVCGLTLPAGAAPGQCPHCLLGLGLALPAEDRGSPEPQHGAPVSNPARSCQLTHAGSETGAPVHGEGTRRIGDYELLEEIARGGMGVVFKARQRSLGRLVALKLLPAGTLAKPEAVKRFQAEASAAAALQHPNIVAIHEIGVQGDQHFIAMDLVDGPPLSRVISELRFTMDDFRRIAHWMKAIAEAVHYAHERGILHRDLKPSNILLGPDDQPRITDFGLAKRFGVPASAGQPSASSTASSDSTIFPAEAGTPNDLTLSGQLLGSPNYMPPEQAAAHRGKASRRSDVYGLGATLYHLLTGRAPFQASSITEVLQQVAHADPLAPRLLQPGVPADLETICLKCLEKEPAKRYATAQALADELNRFLHDEPIHARPVGRVEKAWRWCRRKPALAALNLAAVLLVVAVPTSIGLAGLRDAAVRKAEQREYFAGITLADNYVRIGDIQRALDVLTNCPPRFRHWEWGRLMYACHQDMATISTVTARVDSIVFDDEHTRVCVNADRTRLATVGGASGSLSWEMKLWDLNTGRNVFTYGGLSNRVTRMAFSPDGRHLAMSCKDGAIHLRDASDGGEVFSIAGGGDEIVSLDFNTNGTRLVTVTTRHHGAVWDAQTGQRLFAVPCPAGSYRSVWLDAEAQHLATVDNEGKVGLWSAQTGQARFTLPGVFPLDSALYFSPGGRLLLTGNRYADRSALWETETGDQIANLPAAVQGAAFTPSGTRLATLSGDTLVKVWETFGGTEILTLSGHASQVRFAAFTPDGSQVITADDGCVVKTWRARPGREVLSLGAITESVAISPDGRWIAVGQDNAVVSVWDAETGRREWALRGHLQRVRPVAISPDGQHLVSAGLDKVGKLWDLRRGRERFTLRGHTNSIFAVAFSPDSRFVATGSSDVRIWDAVSGELKRSLAGHERGIDSLAFSPDGRRLVSGGLDAVVAIWDVETGHRLRTLEGHSAEVLAVAFTPDGRQLASAGWDRLIHFWDADSGRRLRTLHGHLNIHSLAFSPDGRRMITATGNFRAGSGHSAIEVWDVETGRGLLSLEGHTSPIYSAVFSADGRRIVSGAFDNTARIWEAFPWNEEAYPGGAELPLADRARHYAEEYWKQRLAAESKARSRKAEPSPPSSRIDRAEFPPRDPATPANLIDLTEHYNGLLNFSWLPMWSIHLLRADLSPLPSGMVRLGDVPFDVRGVVQLRRTFRQDWHERRWRIFPERLEGIRVAGRCRRLRGLLGAIGTEIDGTTIGAVVFHYADGQTREAEIVYGQHVREFWTAEDPKPGITDGVVAWTGSNTATERIGGEVRVFVTQWENPLPEVEVTSLDIVSKMTRSGPTLIALTVER